MGNTVLKTVLNKGTINKKNPPIHGFSYNILIDFSKSRLPLNSSVRTDIIDLYTDYLYYVYSLSEQQKKRYGLENLPKNFSQFVDLALNDQLIAIGLISKRSFGALLERVTKKENPGVERKRSKTFYLQGVGLKSAEGLLAFEKATGSG